MPHQPAPFPAVPGAARLLRPVLPGLADEIVAAIAAEVPDYARAMEGEFGQAVRRGVQTALGAFVDVLEHPGDVDDTARTTSMALGRGEQRAGRSLDALLSAYRVGARLAWRRCVETGQAGGLEPEIMYRLGEAIFAYIDELSANSAEGFADEQSVAAGERQRLRRRLVRLLAQQPPADEEAVRTAAAAAGWALPARVAAVVTGEPRPAAEEGAADALAARLARSLGDGAVGAAVDGVALVLVPDPDAPGARRRLTAALGERPGVVGPAVGWRRTWLSVGRAFAVHGLQAAGRVPADGLVAVEDHLSALLLAADPGLAGELAALRLAPLERVPEGSRARLAETLRAWLDRPGQVQAVAEALGVHPQTVRYRVRRLRELFGERLEDPEGRFELALALRAGHDGSAP